MSVFKKVIEAHLTSQERDKKLREDGAKARAQALADFTSEFSKRIKSEAVAPFEEFAADAKAGGYPATVELSGYDTANPTFAVRLTLEKGAAIERNPSAEIGFALRCLAATEKVEHVSYFDQRPGRDGVKREVYGLGSIKKEIIEAHLEQFFSDALKARAS
jgi:hypothetical protein